MSPDFHEKLTGEQIKRCSNCKIQIYNGGDKCAPCSSVDLEVDIENSVRDEIYSISDTKSLHNFLQENFFDFLVQKKKRERGIE
jgi:hypothetical protein